MPVAGHTDGLDICLQRAAWPVSRVVCTASLAILLGAPGLLRFGQPIALGSAIGYVGPGHLDQARLERRLEVTGAERLLLHR